MSRRGKVNWGVLLALAGVCICGFSTGFGFGRIYEKSMKDRPTGTATDREVEPIEEIKRISSENCFLQLRIERYKERYLLDELESPEEVK